MPRRTVRKQQLSRLHKRTIQRVHSNLDGWPRRATFVSLLLTLAIGFAFLSHVATEAATQVPSRTALAQRTVTRIPTRTATATEIVDSPLFRSTAISTSTRHQPWPVHRPGPQVVPGVAISGSVPPTTTSTGAPNMTAPSVVTDVVALVLPTITPVPTPTISVVEALTLPVAPSGFVGMMAEQPSTEIETLIEVPTESVIHSTARPQLAVPTPTVASIQPPDGTVRTAHVPILMYHYLRVPPDDADIYQLDLSVAPELFAAHLDAMQQAGYTTISLYTLLDNLTQGTPLPDKSVVITFDDGYRDNYTDAFPLLSDRGMTATFFIVTDFVYNQRPGYLSWDMVREMYAGGMSIEAHGRNHVSLANQDRDYLVWQALGSFEAIQVELGVRPRFIAYPAGEYNQLTIDIFRSANYRAGITTKQGATHRSDDLFQLRRVRVRGTTTSDELLRLLALDW